MLRDPGPGQVIIRPRELSTGKQGLFKTVYINADLRYIGAKLIEINGFKED